jgi:phosphoribosylformylglycinamidine synthase I
MSRKIGILRFPGSNCDRDVFSFVEAKGLNPEFLWHLDQFQVDDYSALILPGGFSYGDYLRSGALAARSPAMKSVWEFNKKQKPILGICNGFQILTEAGILPGALVKNEKRRFIDDWVRLEIIHSHPQFAVESERNIRLPVAHGDGRFYAPEDELRKIEGEGLVWMRYKENVNGSLNLIAGVMNQNRNAAALMPHPERAIYDWMGGVDGWNFL